METLPRAGQVRGTALEWELFRASAGFLDRPTRGYLRNANTTCGERTCEDWEIPIFLPKIGMVLNRAPSLGQCFLQSITVPFVLDVAPFFLDELLGIYAIDY